MRLLSYLKRLFTHFVVGMTSLRIELIIITSTRSTCLCGTIFFHLRLGCFNCVKLVTAVIFFRK